MNNMKRHVIKLVRDVVNKYASTTIPAFDEICSGLGLDVKEGFLPDGTDGIQKGTTIIINSQIHNEERKRFTQFHELTHYLIEKDGDLISELHEYTLSQEDGYTRPVESLCNIGAAEFLMPSKEFIRLYEEKGFNVELIVYAARYFKSSTIATTIQVAQVAQSSCIAAVCELIPNEPESSQTRFSSAKDSSTKQKLHIAYSASSPSTKYLLAKGTTIPEDHLINQAFLQTQPVGGGSYVPFRSGKKMPCSCEALADGGRIYALFHLTPPPNPNQETLF